MTFKFTGDPNATFRISNEFRKNIDLFELRVIITTVYNPWLFHNSI